MADTNTKGVFTLNDVRSRQAANAWPVVGVATEASITQSANTVSIGDTINFYTNTKNRFQPGQVVYWAINSNTNSISSVDFTDNSINGAVSANTNSEVILSKTISNNFKDGDIIFNIKLLAGSLNGTVIATSSNVQINKTPPTVPGTP
jgi:phosphoheptose isomerase